jgi:hypothetical protein
MISNSQINQWISNCQDYKHSWIAGFLLEALDGRAQLNWYPDHKFPISNSTGLTEVVVLDDESIMTTATVELVDMMHLPKDVIIITSNELRYKELLDLDFKKLILFPYTHWFLNIIGLRKLNVKIKKETGNRVFNFLNRNWQPGRFHMIEYIFRYYPELLDTGYVTAGQFSYYKDHPKIQTDNKFLEFYHSPADCEIEINNVVIDGIPITLNTKNFIHLAQTIPGPICIQVETFDDSNEFSLALTEKSIMAIATGQIPIIIGKEPYLLKRYLKDQGFDIFDDIIDQSYDSEPDYFQRCELAINLNLRHLKGSNQLPDLTKRFECNQNYLLEAWSNQILCKLVDNIYQLCHN